MLLGTTLPTLRGAGTGHAVGEINPPTSQKWKLTFLTRQPRVSYVAQENTDDANLIDPDDPNSSLVKVNSFPSAVQGAEWSVEEKLCKRDKSFSMMQFHYQCHTTWQTKTILANSIGFDNKDDE